MFEYAGKAESHPGRWAITQFSGKRLCRKVTFGLVTPPVYVLHGQNVCNLAPVYS